MNIQTRKTEFIQAFLQIQSEDLISRLEELLYKERKKATTLEPMSIAEFNQRIDTSLFDSENDRVTESSELMKEVKQWD